MENHQTDDIGRLLQQLDLEKTKYKVFRGGASLLLRGSTPEDVEFEDADETPRALLAGESERLSKRAEVSPSFAPKRLEAPGASSVDRSLSAREPSRSILESLLNLHSVHSAGHSSTEQTAAPRTPGATLYGACGGVGTTTILSALGRISSKGEQRVLLVDMASPSFLPLYFGALSPRSYISTFSSDGRRDCTIHIACGKPGELTSALSSEVDCSYVDAGLYRSKDAVPAEAAAPLAFLVVVPDARCLAELNRLKRQETTLPYILLNQFDVRQSLHREVKQLLSQQFEDRLIPVTIDFDPDVSAALAHGTTIIDYAPTSSVTEDLYKLNQWLVGKSRNVPSLELTVAGQGI